MTHVMHRSLLNTPIIADRSEGVFIYDKTGKAYLDASGGAAVSSIGHGHPAVIEAITKQIHRFAYAHTSFFTSEVAEELADFLIQKAPGDLNNVYFVSGGSEAVEASLKMARQYFVEKGEPERQFFIARKQSYHGNTLGALAVGGNEWRRQQFAPLLMDVGRVSACYEYRDKANTETTDQYTQRLLDEIEQTIQKLDPQKVIGFIAEPVVGATAGALTATPNYFKGVRELCNRYGILFIADEVMCGMGRTGSLYAIEQEDVIPDMITIAKGLGGGYQPIGAVVVRDTIVDTIKKGSGFFQHGHTYIGHPTACAAALAVQKVIEQEKLVPYVATMGAKFGNALVDKFSTHPFIGNVRGRGFFWAIELVQDKLTKSPFDPSLKIHAAIKKNAMNLGLLVYPMGGTIDGKYGDHVLIAPPYITNEEQLNTIIDKLNQAIELSIK